MKRLQKDNVFAHMDKTPDLSFSTSIKVKSAKRIWKGERIDLHSSDMENVTKESGF
jgi:hypothetical protein